MFHLQNILSHFVNDVCDIVIAICPASWSFNTRFCGQADAELSG